MKSNSAKSSVDWVKRINRSWIVHHQLDQRAEAWMTYLGEADDGRLEQSCEMARAMCAKRDDLDDPKPWFYAGLFHLASEGEVKRFLDAHRITKATVPSMSEDEGVALWLDRVSQETITLLDRLKNALREVRDSRSA